MGKWPAEVFYITLESIFARLVRKSYWKIWQEYFVWELISNFPLRFSPQYQTAQNSSLHNQQSSAEPSYVSFDQ